MTTYPSNDEITLAEYRGLTAEQITAAFRAAGINRAPGNTYNQIRCGNVAEAIGTIKAGVSPNNHKKSRQAFRRKIRELLNASATEDST